MSKFNQEKFINLYSTQNERLLQTWWISFVFGIETISFGLAIKWTQKKLCDQMIIDQIQIHFTNVVLKRVSRRHEFIIT